jgi:hypothetical protein
LAVCDANWRRSTARSVEQGIKSGVQGILRPDQGKRPMAHVLPGAGGAKPHCAMFESGFLQRGVCKKAQTCSRWTWSATSELLNCWQKLAPPSGSSKPEERPSPQHQRK